MIKSEDVKRFEQLLENLRSLSLNVEKAQSRLINKSVNPNRQTAQKRKEQEAEENNDDGQYREDSDQSNSPKSSWNGQEFKSSNQPKVHSSSNSKSTHSDVATTSDCDRQRNQQQQQQQQQQGRTKSFNSDDSSAEPDSSPSIVDQDPITSNDGGDDLNDESSQNIEQEEQGSDNHNKLTLPYTKTIGPEDRSRVETKPAAVEEQPRSLFVRKTVLQNYYDNEARERANELERMHRLQHEEQHRRHLESQPDLRPTVSEQRQQASDNQNGRSSANQQETYIDYNKLDDREVFRGRDQRVKPDQAAPARNQVDRMRTLQQLIERAAVEGYSDKEATSRS